MARFQLHAESHSLSGCDLLIGSSERAGTTALGTVFRRPCETCQKHWSNFIHLSTLELTTHVTDRWTA